MPSVSEALGEQLYRASTDAEPLDPGNTAVARFGSLGSVVARLA